MTRATEAVTNVLKKWAVAAEIDYSKNNEDFPVISMRATQHDLKIWVYAEQLECHYNGYLIDSEVQDFFGESETIQFFCDRLAQFLEVGPGLEDPLVPVPLFGRDRGQRKKKGDGG